MGAGGRAVILFIARLAWVAMLAVTAGLTWLIWSVASEEAETEGFTLRTIISGRDPVDLPIEIAPGESIEETVAVPAGGGTLYVRLLKPTDEGDVVYRRVRVNLPLTSPAPPAD